MNDCTVSNCVFKNNETAHNTEVKKAARQSRSRSKRDALVASPRLYDRLQNNNEIQSDADRSKSGSSNQILTQDLKTRTLSLVIFADDYQKFKYNLSSFELATVDLNLFIIKDGMGNDWRSPEFGKKRGEPFTDLMTAARKADAVSMCIQHKNGTVIESCNDHLPKAVLGNLLHFLRFGRPEGKYYCADFIHHLCGVPQPKPTVIDSTLWKWDLIDSECELVHGDCICLTDLPRHQADRASVTVLNGRGKHFALYVGSGIYLSMYGKGPIGFASLNQMQAIYEVQGVVVRMRAEAEATASVGVRRSRAKHIAVN